MNDIERFRATYNLQPVDHLFRREFYIWDEALEQWKTQGLPGETDLNRHFGYDQAVNVHFERLGWCSPAFVPAIEEKVIESTDEYEVVRDDAGRLVRFFKGRRHGFMPTYLKHAVSCERDWVEDIAPLLDPDTPQRWADFEARVGRLLLLSDDKHSRPLGLEEMKQAAGRGLFVTQRCIGGYMYLRALVGPEDICYMFVDNPGLIHQMMQQWLALADAVTARIQGHVEIDELFLAEDICYNHGPLIGPDMIREFLLPYYQQLLENTRRRQRRRLFLQVDTDGRCREVIPLYRQIGMDMMSPFEVAAGNNVVEIAREFPDLLISGGIDKRVLAAGPAAIDEYLQRVIPVMVARGGYVPTCDHGVPDNVSYANYMHYRKRIMELDH